jgi:hypothetical protein
MARQSEQFYSISSFGKTARTEKKLGTLKMDFIVSDVVNHYLFSLKQRRGEGGNTANNARHLEVKSDTKSGEGKNLQL